MASGTGPGDGAGGPAGRLLTLLSLLQSRRDWPGTLLSQRLQVSPRTVRRDVDRLRELGYPVHATMGPEGGYRLGPGADVPPLLLDDDQAVAVAIALQTATASGVGTGEAAWRALATLRQVMPSRLRHRIDAVRVSALPSGSQLGGQPASGTVDPDVLLAVTSAAHQQQVLHFDYASPTSRRAEEVVRSTTGEAAPPAAPLRAPRRVEPHDVLTRGTRWYLLCWDLEAAGWRTYRLDRMSPRTPLGAHFARRRVPGGDAGEFVSTLFRGAADPARADAWPCHGQVVLHAPAEAVAPYAGEAAVTALGPERCRVAMGAWSWIGLAAALLRFDAALEEVSPPPLAEAFATMARRCQRAATT